MTSTNLCCAVDDLKWPNVPEGLGMGQREHLDLHAAPAIALYLVYNVVKAFHSPHQCVSY